MARNKYDFSHPGRFETQHAVEKVKKSLYGQGGYPASECHVHGYSKDKLRSTGSYNRNVTDTTGVWGRDKPIEKLPDCKTYKGSKEEVYENLPNVRSTYPGLTL